MASETFRFFRTDQLDTWASLEDQPRDDLLRELIDQLPEVQQHLISRVYFGQSQRNEAAAEAGISAKKAKEQLEEGLETLRRLLLEDGRALGALSTASVERHRADQPGRAVSQSCDMADARS